MMLDENASIFRHVTFWVFVLGYFVLTSNLMYFEDYTHLLLSSLTLVLMQIITAYVTFYFLMPKFLDRNKPFIFLLGLLITLFGCLVLYINIRIHYFDLVYSHTYSQTALEYIKKPLHVRLMDISLIVSKSLKFVTPTVILLMWHFYSSQRKYLELKEQKKTSELAALRHQINPHFLFNTLNNLYALSIEKSDKTPIAIEKLSDMLDYMLYKCSDNFVLLSKEVENIESYISLEGLRYSDRVDINLDIQVQPSVMIAPLILLTFVENAFKHGVSQELNKAKIEIKVYGDNEKIEIMVYNTKPKFQPKATSKDSLGMNNVKQQLQLLYPEKHTLDIIDSGSNFTVSLKINNA